MTEATGLGGGSTKTRKMLRPAPSYFVSSLDFNKSNRRLGSRFCATSFLAPLLFALLLRSLAGEVGAAGFGDEVPAEAEPGEPVNQGDTDHANNTTATTPNATAAMTLFRFSAPRFTYAVLRNVSSLIRNLTCPVCTPPSSSPSMMKNSWLRSSVLMNFARGT